MIAGCKASLGILELKSFAVRAFRADGDFAFGVTLSCKDAAAAIAKFNTLPLGGLRAELLYRGQVIARRAAEGERAAHA